MIANWELASRREVYWTAKAAHRNGSGYVEREEALFNAYMLRGFQRPTRALKTPGASVSLREYCDRQPLGYKDGPNLARNHREYVSGCQSLSADYQHASVTVPDQRVPDALDTSLLYPDIRRIAWARCPIFILDDHNVLGSLGITLDLFQSIPVLTETDAFKGDLKKLDKSISSKWDKCKRMLAEENSTGLKGLGFERWKADGRPNCYSVRVDRKIRAHLEYIRNDKAWLAFKIGPHGDMGHG